MSMTFCPHGTRHPVHCPKCEEEMFKPKRQPKRIGAVNNDIGGMLEDLVRAATESGVCNGLDDDTQAACDRISGAFKHAERERDEARAALAIAEQVKDSLGRDIASVFAGYEQAVALLREVEDSRECCGEKPHQPGCRLGTFLAGQPAPVKTVVDDAMVVRATHAWFDGPVNCADGSYGRMRAALVAALEGKS